jgi:hypothetical protein
MKMHACDMNGQLERLTKNHQPASLSLSARWVKLCDLHLPTKPEGSIWRYSRESLPDDPEQGWKLHVSATVLTAGPVLRAVSSFLHSRRALYKAPASLHELDKLNSGIFYGYSQVGKFLTVYPRTDEEALVLADGLYQLTRRMNAPAVPFDFKYRRDGCVYYRYGAFKTLEVEDPAGGRTYAIRDSEGNLIPDTRWCAGKPDWAPDPFLEEDVGSSDPDPAVTPLKTTFRAFRALAQRGRGGVYQALDLSVTPPRLCILKEGRKDGEMSWDGRDGFWRVRHEGRVLASLFDAGLNVPRVYASFSAEENYYIAIEFIEGESLDAWLRKRRRRLTVASALRLGAELARLVGRVHSAGWVWRDCKPGNIFITKAGELRPLDFEGACPVDDPDRLPWGTPIYIPPEGDADFCGQSRLPEDLYALGAVIYLLLAGRPPDAPGPVPLAKMRRNVPPSVPQVVAELLGSNPDLRPGALSVAVRLEEALSAIATGRVHGTRSARRAKSANLGSERRSS